VWTICANVKIQNLGYIQKSSQLATVWLNVQISHDTIKELMITNGYSIQYITSVLSK